MGVSECYHVDLSVRQFDGRYNRRVSGNVIDERVKLANRSSDHEADVTSGFAQDDGDLLCKMGEDHAIILLEEIPNLQRTKI